MADNRQLHPRPVQLPASIDEWERKIKTERTLNDHIEDLHLMLWNDSEDYRRFLEAVWDSDAVEGSLAIDNVKAAELLREKARTIAGHIVGTKKLDTIVKSLGVVLRRYEFSRKERRHTVEGKIVRDGDGNGNTE
jgi:hypothetical protein